MVSESRLPVYQRFVDGLVLPIGLGGHPALDFANTLAGWSSAEPREYLTTYAHLAVWARDAHLIEPVTETRLRRKAEHDPGQGARQLERARGLRGALYAACTDPSADTGWAAVEREAHEAAEVARLVRDAPPGRRWVIPDGAGLAMPVMEVARAAGDLLASTDLRQVRCCPGRDCGWLFLDPRGQRRWCTMAVCGNRAKARRHAQRALRRAGSGRERR